MSKKKNEIPDFSSSYFGFNKFSEKLNGRIAMISFVIIFLIEYIFHVKILDILSLKIFR